MKEQTLTRGNILHSLLKFAVPVLLALFLQAMYGAADLIIVGKFAGTSEQSGVATGSQLFNLVTMAVTGLSMGITVFVGNAIGAGDKERAGQGIGTGIFIFGVLAVIVTVPIVAGSEFLSAVMHAPESAFSATNSYIRICGIGTIFIVAYNLFGAIFRGVGDSATPLITVAIAMSLLALFGGALLSSVFSNEQAVITAAHSYLKAYAIDCLLTSVLFCFIGYFNGCKHTIFVMIQGVAGAFFVRIPVVYLMSRMDEATLFLIGLGTPVSSAVQIILCLAALLYFRKKEKNKEEPLA